MADTLRIDTAPTFAAPCSQPTRGLLVGGVVVNHISSPSSWSSIASKPRHPRGLYPRDPEKPQGSAKRLIEDKIETLGVGGMFKIQNEQIITPGDGVIVFMGMRDHTKESIKSLEGFNICWVEEAQTLSKGSLDMLRPTIRAEGSEIWFSWNPRLKSDPVDAFLRGDEPPTDAIVVRANYDANPWFPEVLNIERLDYLRADPDGYDHIWNGAYITAMPGAYYTRHLREAREEGRVCGVAADPLLPYRAFWDIGGTGAKADARSTRIAQFVGKEIRLIDYRETVGQPLAQM